MDRYRGHRTSRKRARMRRLKRETAAAPGAENSGNGWTVPKRFFAKCWRWSKERPPAAASLSPQSATHGSAGPQGQRGLVGWAAMCFLRSVSIDRGDRWEQVRDGTGQREERVWRWQSSPCPPRLPRRSAKVARRPCSRTIHGSCEVSGRSSGPPAAGAITIDGTATGPGTSLRESSPGDQGRHPHGPPRQE